MQIEVGKFYRTRDGCKVRIYALDGNVDNCIHGAFFELGIWQSLVWNSNGSFQYDSYASALDIVGAWTDKVSFNAKWQEAKIGFDLAPFGDDICEILESFKGKATKVTIELL